MEIIEELEPTRRGPYAGAVGYLSFSGNLDFCITIRSFTVHQGQVYLQVGAGIVRAPLECFVEALEAFALTYRS